MKLEDKKMNTHIIIHHSRAKKIHPQIIRPLHLIHRPTITRNLRPIINMIILTHEPRALLPRKDLLRPIRIRGIARIPGQPRRNIEETPIRNAILVIIPRVEREDLPSQPAPTDCRVPPLDHELEHRLREGYPSCVAGGRIHEFCFCGCESGHGPESLVVVPFCFGLVAGHEIVVVAYLV